MALTIALIGRPGSVAEALDGYDAVWLVLVAGGVLTAILCLPLRTRRPS